MPRQANRADRFIFYFVTDVGILSILYFSAITTSVGKVLSSLLCPSVTEQFIKKQKAVTANTVTAQAIKNYSVALNSSEVISLPSAFKILRTTTGLSIPTSSFIELARFSYVEDIALNVESSCSFVASRRLSSI